MMRLNSKSQALLFGIIGSNVLVTVSWQSSFSDRKLNLFMRKNFTVSNYAVFKRKQYHTIVTSIFSHQDIGHLLTNMVSLYFVGSTLLCYMSPARFLGLYMASGVASSYCQIMLPKWVPRQWPAARHQSIYDTSLGASGSLNGIVSYYILNFPRQVIYLYFVIPIPAAILGAGFIMKDAYGLYYGNNGIGNGGHLTGAVTGLAYFLLRRRLPI